MRSWRENPDGEENQKASRDNERYIGGLKLEYAHGLDAVPMEAYSFDISRATDAAALLTLKAAITEDVTLEAEEKSQLQTAINNRFGQLNAQALGPQKGRW